MPNIESIHSFWHEASLVWTKGGWLMHPLFILTLYIYHTAFSLLLHINRHPLLQFQRKTQQKTKNLKTNSQIDIDLSHLNSKGDLQRYFDHLHQIILAPLKRRSHFLAILISAGPLMGLLGTVTGILNSFNGLSSNSGDKFQSIVRGISEALITTQTGLLIAIPAYFILAIIIQKRKTLENALHRLEQYQHRQIWTQTKFSNPKV